MENGSYINSRVYDHLKDSVETARGEEIVYDKGAKISEDELMQIKGDKIISFLKQKYSWISYIFLAIVVFLAVRIRTRNLDGLRDITTGGWTLGPDLDPFLFLRYAEYIVEHGKLFAVDMMRNVPLGFETDKELILHPQMIAFFHNVAVMFGSESVTQSAAIYPVVMFGLAVIAFFFMTRSIFLPKMGHKKASIIALMASFLLSVVPSLLPRTIAGIPEKESGALVFLFLAFYFFLKAWNSEKIRNKIALSLLSGISTAFMGLIWGGHIYIYTTLAPVVLFAFILGKVDKKNIITYTLWLISAITILASSTARFKFLDLMVSTTTGAAFLVLGVLWVDYLMFETPLRRNQRLKKIKLPRQITTLITTFIFVLILSSIVLGPSFVFNKTVSLKNQLVTPTTDRVGVTVAENRQPFFTEWAGSFGPGFRGIPVLFWMFFAGSIYLFGHMVSSFRKKERAILIIGYIIFLFALIFSRYSGDSVLNGTNAVSLFVYVAGFIAFIGSFGYPYFSYHKNGEKEKLKDISFNLIFIFIFFFISILSARSAVRLIMMLVPAASIISSYFVVALVHDAKRVKAKLSRTLVWAIVGIAIAGILFVGYGYYSIVSHSSAGHVPSVYNQQWQKAMSWVRENTSESAVFGHWWDYGYWVQSIGKRATVLDGGNALPYWNYLMGRYALTGTSDREALDYLFSHNTTHFLIDSSDIGKYGAFSSIGSDENYDRSSFIPTFSKNNQASRETKNSTIYIYQGGVGLDEDIIYQEGENGTRIFLPAGSAGVGGVMIERDKNGQLKNQPKGLFIYQGQQYTLPLRYAYIGGFIDFGTGVEAGFFMYPRVGDDNQIEFDGSMLYLSPRTVKSQLVRLYLFQEENEYFKPVHSEDDFVVSQIKTQNPNFDSDFLNYHGFRGPIRIWEISYPEDIEVVPEYVQVDFPGKNLLQEV